MTRQTAEITWRDGRVPVSERFDDPYFSMEDGLAETRHVFLAGNGLPDRFKRGFHIGELGFGTGLNMLAAWQAWRDHGIEGDLTFTSFEAFPMSAEDMQKAVTAFPQLSGLAGEFIEAWDKGATEMQLPGLAFSLILGDARRTLPKWNGPVDAWFLDGFAPAKNPEMWDAGLLKNVGLKTAPDGSFATYSAAGSVRRALADAGFTVQRTPGFAGKRHMTIGQLEYAK